MHRNPVLYVEVLQIAAIILDRLLPGLSSRYVNFYNSSVNAAA